MPIPEPISSAWISAATPTSKAFRLLGLLAVVMPAMAILLVARPDPALLAHGSMPFASALGVGFTVLVGTGLRTLAFISNSSRHDERG